MVLAQTATASSFGELLRGWRMRRRLSQLQLAVDAEISSRHLSFLETGRAKPSREMVIHLAEHLDVPLRERNPLLLAAGFAPAYDQRPLAAPEMDSVRQAIELVLAAHEPYPAIVVDRYWNLVLANPTVPLLIEGLPAELLTPPVNVYRLSFHPDGLPRRMANFAEYATHFLGRLRHDVAVSGDPQLSALLAEVEAYPTVDEVAAVTPSRSSVVLPMRLLHPTGELALFSTVATFGTPVDITVSELAIETFFPADTHTAQFFQNAASPSLTGGTRT
ncbi:MAG: helix-turn-helix domain-containing protein [Acidimicrobiia bacterium]